MPSCRSGPPTRRRSPTASVASRETSPRTTTTTTITITITITITTSPRAWPGPSIPTSSRRTPAKPDLLLDTCEGGGRSAGAGRPSPGRTWPGRDGSRTSDGALARRGWPASVRGGAGLAQIAAMVALALAILTRGVRSLTDPPRRPSPSRVATVSMHAPRHLRVDGSIAADLARGLPARERPGAGDARSHPRRPGRGSPGGGPRTADRRAGGRADGNDDRSLSAPSGLARGRRPMARTPSSPRRTLSSRTSNLLPSRRRSGRPRGPGSRNGRGGSRGRR